LEILLRAHDDDARVLVLISPTVSCDSFAQTGFPTRRLTVLSSFVLSLADPVKLVVAAAAVEKWEAR
jgi:hypothetical protein